MSKYRLSSYRYERTDDILVNATLTFEQRNYRNSKNFDSQRILYTPWGCVWFLGFLMWCIWRQNLTSMYSSRAYDNHQRRRFARRLLSIERSMTLITFEPQLESCSPFPLQHVGLSTVSLSCHVFPDTHKLRDFFKLRLFRECRFGNSTRKGHLKRLLYSS